MGISFRRALVMFAVTCSCVAADLRAQSSPDDSQPSLRCYRGRPAPACRTFVLTEIGYYQQLATTSSSSYRRSAGDSVVYRVNDFGNHASVEAGIMQNRGPNTAVGASIVLRADAYGARYGARLRYRRWLAADGLSADVSTGVVSGTFSDFNRTAILSTDVALNFSDYGALVARIEAAHVRRRTPTAVFGGVRLGSKPGLIATILAAIASLLAVIALLSLFSGE